MPCYNEEGTIEQVVLSFHHEVISKIENSEFIVIDDSSTDSSYEILRELEKKLCNLKILQTKKNSGHGKAILIGYKHASKEHVFQVDSDNQFDPKDFHLLYELKDNFDFILGFRKIRDDPYSRIILSIFLRIINRIIFRTNLKDCNCPFRIIKRSILFDLLSYIDNDSLTPNILLSILAKKKGVKLIEVPISHYKRKTGEEFGFSFKLINFSLRAHIQLLKLRGKI